VNICRKAIQATYPVTRNQFLPTGAPVSVPVRQDEEESWQHPTPQSCKLLTLVMEKLTKVPQGNPHHLWVEGIGAAPVC
jgi:hypothetical protein